MILICIILSIAIGIASQVLITKVLDCFRGFLGDWVSVNPSRWYRFSNKFAEYGLSKDQLLQVLHIGSGIVGHKIVIAVLASVIAFLLLRG